MRARMKRRQNVRRLEIVAIVAVVAVAVVVGFYLAMNTRSANDAYIGKPLSQSVYSRLYQASQASYGASDSAYLKDVQNVTGPLFSTDGKPILVSATGEFCSPCALQRWPLVMALMRFGSFTNLDYMTSSAAEGDYSTFAFAASSYNSSYVVFQPYEVYDRAGNPLDTLPTNYSSANQQYGNSKIPFLDFADKYVISGPILSNPGLLGTKNWTQIISSIQAGDALGSQIMQAANLITAVICKTTGDSPASVCDSIPALTVSYTPPSASSGSELILNGVSFTMSQDAFFSGRDYSGWS
ncbi:MAG: DUF929 family protein [Nitrososphaerales archaeon]|jgi:hypothetical protein